MRVAQLGVGCADDEVAIGSGEEIENLRIGDEEGNVWEVDREDNALTYGNGEEGPETERENEKGLCCWILSC
jgi:hypothetical protein